MKKILAIVLPIVAIIGALVLLYLFVIADIVDPPPDKVMQSAIEAAQEYAGNNTESNETKFLEHFSLRTRQGLENEWRALALDGTRRGSWYEMAVGLLNSDGTLPEVLGFTLGATEEGEEEAEEEEEEEETQATVTIRQNRVERDIPLVRDQGRWRIELPFHPTPWATLPPAGG